MNLINAIAALIFAHFFNLLWVRVTLLECQNPIFVFIRILDRNFQFFIRLLRFLSR